MKRLDPDKSTQSDESPSSSHSDKPSAVDQETALKTILGIEREGSSEPQVKAKGKVEPDEESDKVLFAVDREGIKSAIQEITDEIKECYEGWVRQNKALEGRMLVSFVIDHTEGEVAEATLRDVYLSVDEVKHPMISGCMLNLIEDLHFENVDSKVTVSYPFRFGTKP